ncbi:hypothetical protein A3F07_03935 [candidate division WWE3 bacterium RIFCSPHIGHO2_12_FULL_38_15]|uniref:Thioredoxin domain-containing protein n=1 Tax=candidate division WWE3 bacterium RIFCSPHIGHO2_02_FULL_38_14 TaxID=1802620 RepID=A0A1F4V7V6_UNCKA|nr:MAG: hypothetical protein A2793_00165 [candidate division WWE3 bacterium RIFCSPHIGHO2_01_FULL_38_45]OGC48962.1 MAG: hypothetical protein A3F07_03935 [candidate division WWE3 bacterium RIFCSPHIGHO2_12_FULL_38_15]OGC53268.1 MAG: hypothetical protein A3D91_02530 [candidate division WWE3 bacterium RIFCSPHIGHO2_02_FULL_38_14]OGC53713.1 MAG: hypothetical protein A3B64_04760 [candidate division WWE3 bacterium RIFCSPLOWO2_01_FULL_37_24]
MSEESNNTNLLKQLGTNNIIILFLVILLLGASFFIGVLFTKVKMYESGSGASGPTTAGNGTAPSAQAAVPTERVAGDVKPIGKDDHFRGNPNARIALIEYSDLECPFCKRFHPTAKQVVDTYINDVMWVYRHFPIDQLHSKADKEAEAVECAYKLAGNDGFWKLTDKIFEVTPANNGLDLATLPDLAAGVGLNKQAFQTCLDSGEMAIHIEEDYQSGITAGVNGTPGNILLDTKTGKTRVIPGAVPFDQIKQAIDEMLKS